MVCRYMTKHTTPLLSHIGMVGESLIDDAATAIENRAAFV